MLEQVHSARVLVVDKPTSSAGEGDALITSRSGLLVGVRTADCVPILLVDESKRVVAAVHAGWRGTAAGILACTISEMTVRFGTAPGDIWAAIGPAIGSCCYEVGPEVARQFAQWWPELTGTERHAHLDLTATNCIQLRQCGLPDRQIFAGLPCTVCTEEMHSFRRDRDQAGRMVAAIGIR